MYIYVYVDRSGMKEVYIYIWIEEFAKTCGMGVGDEGVYIYIG